MLQLPSLSGRVVGCEPAVLPCVLQDVAPVIGPGGSLDAIGEMWLRQLAKEGVEERTNTPDRRPKEPSRVHVHAALLTQRASPLRAPTSVSPGPEGPLAVSLWQRSLFFSVLDALSATQAGQGSKASGGTPSSPSRSVPCSPASAPGSCALRRASPCARLSLRPARAGRSEAELESGTRKRNAAPTATRLQARLRRGTGNYTAPRARRAPSASRWAAAWPHIFKKIMNCESMALTVPCHESRERKVESKG